MSHRPFFVMVTPDSMLDPTNPISTTEDIDFSAIFKRLLPTKSSGGVVDEDKVKAKKERKLTLMQRLKAFLNLKRRLRQKQVKNKEKKLAKKGKEKEEIDNLPNDLFIPSFEDIGIDAYCSSRILNQYDGRFVMPITGPNAELNRNGVTNLECDGEEARSVGFIRSVCYHTNQSTN